MPDLINPILDYNSVEIPNIPIALPDSKAPDFPLPSEILAAKQQLQQIPEDQLTASLFNQIVSSKDTLENDPEREKNLSLAEASKGFSPNVKTSDEFNFTIYKSADSLRYRRNNRLFNEIGYNPLVPTDVLDAQYDLAESTWESFKNVVPKLWATTKFAFSNYFREYLDTAAAIHALDSKLLYDDERFTQHADYLKELEELYPNYASDKPGRGFGQIFTGDFWEESAPSLGFTLGTAAAAITEGAVAGLLTLPTGGVSVAIESVNTPRKIFKAISEYFSLKRAYNLIKAVGVGVKTGQAAMALKAGANIWRLTNGALAEASLEGALNKKDYVDGFIQDYINEYGYRPSDESIALAAQQGDKMAKATILFQTPFLMASNAVQLGNLVAPRTVMQLMERWGLKKGAWELFADSKTFGIGVKATKELPTTLFGKISQKAAPFLRGSVWEGTEESYQALVSKATADYYNDEIFNKDDNSLLKSIGAGFDYVTSNDGLKEFLAGFSTGSMFTGIKMPIDYFSKVKTSFNKETGEKEYKKNFLNKVGFGMEEYYSDQEKEQLQKIADTLNANDVFKVFGEEGFLNSSKDKQTEFLLAKFLQKEDMFNMEHAQNIQLMRMLYTGLTTGKLDLQIQRIVDFANQDFATLSEFLETRGITDAAEQQKWAENFKAFANQIQTRSNDMERSFRATQKENEGYTSKINTELSNTTKIFNNALIVMRNKYKLAPDAEFEAIKNAASQEDKEQLDNLNKLNLTAAMKYTAIQEMLKMQVFAQMGMTSHSLLAKMQINKLNSIKGLNYSNIGDIFDTPSRERKIQQLKDDIEVTEASSDTKRANELKTDLENLEAISAEIEKKFKDSTPYDAAIMASLISNYVRNQRNNEGKKTWSTYFESNETDKLLREFVELENRFRENLNLFNTTTQALKGASPEKYLSKRILEFLADVANMKEEKKAATTKVAAKPASTASATTTPPTPPTPPTSTLFDRKDGNTSIKRNPSILRALWFADGATQTSTEQLTSTYTTPEVNEDATAEIIPNTGSKDRVVNFESATHMMVFTPQPEIFQFFTTINGNRVELGRIQDPSTFVIYRKVGANWVHVTPATMTLEDFKEVFSVPGALTEEDYANEFNKYLQNIANLNNIKSQLKAGKSVKELATIVLSIGQQDYVPQGLGYTLSELIDNLPANVKVLGVVNKEANKPVLIYTNPATSEDGMVILGNFLDQANSQEDNLIKSSLNKIGRYSAILQTPNGTRVIELKAIPYTNEQLDALFTDIKAQSDLSVKENLNDKGESIKNTFNNDFQKDVLNKIFITVDQENLFKRGFQVRLILNPNGSLRLGLSKKNVKGEVVDLTKGNTNDKLNIILTTKELESIKSMDDLLDAFNKKLSDKNLKNMEANSIVLTRNSFKVSIDAEFSFDLGLTLTTGLQGKGFKNPVVRLDAIKNVPFTKVNPPANPSTPPAFDISTYKGKKFNFRKPDGKVVEILVQGATSKGDVIVQYTPSTDTGIWSPNLFLKGLTQDPLTPAEPAETKKTVRKRDTSKVQLEAAYQPDFSFLDALALSRKDRLTLTSDKLQLGEIGGIDQNKLEEEWNKGMAEVNELNSASVKDAGFIDYFSKLDQSGKEFQDTWSDVYDFIWQYFDAKPMTEQERVAFAQKVLQAVLYDRYLRSLPEEAKPNEVTEELTEQGGSDPLADEIAELNNNLFVGDIVTVKTEKNGQAEIKEIRGDKALLSDGRQVSLKNLEAYSTPPSEGFDPDDNNDIADQDDSDDAPFKIVDATYTANDEFDNAEFVEFMKRALPDSVFSHKEVESIGKRLSNGNVKVGRFLMSLRSLNEGIKGSIETTGNAFKYHEAFHGIYRLLLSESEQNSIQRIALEAIYSELSKKNKSLNQELEEFRATYPEKYNALNREQLKRLYVEEWLADKFDDYKTRDLIPKSDNALTRFFKNLWNFIKNIFRNYTADAWGAENELNRFFKDIDRGVYRNRQVQLNPFTAKLYEEGFGEIEANKIRIEKGRNKAGKRIYDYLSDSDTYAAIGTVFNAFIQDVQDKHHYNKNQVLETILDDLRDTVRLDWNEASASNQEKLQDILSLYSRELSRKALKEEVSKLLDYIGYTQELESEKDEDITDDIGDRRHTESYSDSEHFGGFKSLSKEVRQYLATINAPYQFSNGRTATIGGRMLYSQLFLPFIYNGILKSTAGTTTDVDFLEKLRQFAKYNSNTKAFVLKFFKDIYDTTGMADVDNLDEYDLANPALIKNATLFNVFRNNFKTMALTYKIVGYDIGKKQSIIINANTRNSAKLQFQKWANAFIQKKNSVQNRNVFTLNATKSLTNLERSLKNDNLTSQEALELSVKHSNEILAETGMKFHPLLLRLTLLKNVKGEKSREDGVLENLYADVLPVDYRDISNISRSIGHGQNPFLAFFETSELENGEEVNLKETGAKTRLLNLAVENAKLDEFVWDSVFVNAEKKKVWTHQSPTYSSTVFKEIQQGLIVPDNSTLYNRDEFQAVLSYINLERHGGLNPISLSTEGEIDMSLQVNKNPGTTYGGLDTRSLYISLFSSYFDSRTIQGITVTPHLTRILEASNTGNMIQLPVLEALAANGTTLSDQVLDILVTEFEKESESVRLVMKQLTGKAGSYTRVKGYNDGDITLERNHRRYPRGAKFFAFSELLGDADAEYFENIIRDAVDNDIEGKIFTEKDINDLKQKLNNYFLGADGLVNRTLEDMRKEGVITVNNQDKYENRFLPNDFFGTISAPNKAKIGALHIVDKGENIFLRNAGQFLINDFVNTFLWNNMIYKNHTELFKDSVDIIKRAKGENAGGPSIYSELIAPHLGIHHPTTNFDLVVKPTEEYFSELKGESQDRMDAQSFITEKMFRHIMFALGRLDDRTASIYDKITNGTENVKDVFGEDGLIEYNRQTNVLKLVYFDGLTGTYIKTSSLVLTKKLTSFQDSNGDWVSLPHRRKLHQLRTELEELENPTSDLTKGKLVWVATSSASKMRSVLATNGAFENLKDNEEFIQKDLSTIYLRLQVENPSNKKTGIIDPTQYKHIIDTEQNPDQIVQGYESINGGPATIREIQESYQADSIQRLKLNYLLGRTAIFDITTEEGRQAILHEVTNSIKQNQITPKLDKFRQIAVQTLKASGATSQTISFFEGDFEMNSPFIREKFENLISAFFTNYGFKEKVPGYSFTLASDSGMKVVKKASVRYVNNKRIVEWSVIPTNNVVNMMKNNAKTLSNIKEYATPLIGTGIKELSSLRQQFEDELIDGEFFIDELQHNVPVYDKEGNILEHYTEVIIPAHHREMEEMLRSGQPIPASVLAMFGVRIPSQDKSSAMTLRVVDFAPAHLGSTIWAAKELIEVSGADFDVDKLYAQIVDMYFRRNENNQISAHKYGDARTEDEAYEEYKKYHLKNNKLLKDSIFAIRTETVRIEEINNRLKALYKENDIVSQEFQKKIEDTWQQHIKEELISKESPAPINKQEIEIALANLNAQLEGETNFKKLAKIRYAITEQERLLSEAMIASNDVNDGSGVSSARLEHEKAIADRVEFWNTINAEIKALKEERTILLEFSEKEAFRITGLATSAAELAAWNDRYGEQNPGVLNNSLLGYKSILQSNPYIVENGLDVEAVTLSIFNDFREDPAIAPYLEKDISLYPDTLLGKIKHQKSNKEGASNIAPAVNTMLVYTLFHKYGVTLKPGEEITVDGVSYNNYSNDRTATGNRIFKVICQVITAMTDNAKERIAFKHNLTLDSIPVFVHMVSLGISERAAQALLLNPAVKEYYRLIRENKLSVKDFTTVTSAENIRKSLLAKFKADEALGYDYTTDGLLNALENPTEEDNHHALKLLFKLESHVAPFSDVLNIVKLPKGLYNGFNTFRDLRTSMENLELIAPTNATSLFDEQAYNPWAGLEQALDSHYTGQMLRQTQELGKISKKLSIPITDIFGKLIHSVYNQVDVKRYNRENFYKNLINDYLSFLSTKIYLNNKKGAKIEKMLNSSILVGDRSLGNLILEARKRYAEVYPGRTSTLLNEYLTVETAKVKQVNNGVEVEVDNPENTSGFDVVKSNTFTNIDENELSLLQNDYQNLLSSGDDLLFDTAMGMYAYAIVKDGHMFKAGGLLQILPNNIMQEYMNTLSIVKQIFAENDDVVDMKKLNNKTKELFEERFGMSLFNLTKEFSQMYLENFNNRDNLTKVRSLVSDSKTITKFEGGFTVDLFKGVKDRDLSTEQIDAMLALNMNPSQFPENFFKEEFGQRLSELRDKGFSIFPVEENGKKRWKISFPYVVKTSFKNQETGFVNTYYYKLKSINTAKNTNFQDFYNNDMNLLSDTAEYERMELNGGFQLSSISGMFGELPRSIRKKILNESHEQRTLESNLRDALEMGFIDENYDAQGPEILANEELSEFERKITDLDNPGQSSANQGPTERYSKLSGDVAALSFEEAVTFSDYLSKKFGIAKRVVNSPAEMWAAKIKGDLVIINAAYAKYSDGWHEFSHPLLMSMKKTNRQLFDNLYESLKSTSEWAEIYRLSENKVRRLYPEYAGDLNMYKEEVLATALGIAASNKTTATNAFLRIINQIIDWISRALNLDIYSRIYISEVDPNMAFSDFVNLFVSEETLVTPDEGWEIQDGPVSLKSEIVDFNKKLKEMKSTYLANKLKISERTYNPRFPTSVKKVTMYEDGTSLVEGTDKGGRVRKQVKDIVKSVLRPYTEENISSTAQHITNSFEISTGSADGTVVEDTKGTPIEVTTDFMRKLENDLTGKTQLDKPFSSSTASSKENEILTEFYNQYLEDIKAFFKGKPIPKSIDNKRLLNKYKTWLANNYPVRYFLTPKQQFTYGLNSAIEPNSRANVKEGYEVLLSNKFLYQKGHTYNLVDDNFESVYDRRYNATGWYIFHELFGDTPLLYEYQSDVIDDLEGLKYSIDRDTGNLTEEGKESLKEQAGYRIENFINSVDNVNDINFDMFNLKHFATTLYGNTFWKSALREISTELTDEQFKKLVNSKVDGAIFILNELQSSILEDYQMIAYFKETNFKQRLGYLRSLNANAYQLLMDGVLRPFEIRVMMDQIRVKYYGSDIINGNAYVRSISSNSNRDLPLAEDALNHLLSFLGSNANTREKVVGYLETPLKAKMLKARSTEIELYTYGQIKEEGEEKFYELFKQHKTLLMERIESSLFLLAVQEYKNFVKENPLATQEFLDAKIVELRDAYEDFATALDKTDISNLENISEQVIKQTMSMKSNQLRFFIEHSLQFAKSKGHKEVYLPTAEFINTVESGDPWTLYVTPHDQKDERYKNSPLGSFYEALLEVPDIKFSYVNVPGVKPSLIKVDISNFIKPVERFSKVDKLPVINFSSENKCNN